MLSPLLDYYQVLWKPSPSLTSLMFCTIFATMALGCITSSPKNKRAKLLDYSSVLAFNISQWYPVLLIHSSVKYPRYQVTLIVNMGAYLYKACAFSGCNNLHILYPYITILRHYSYSRGNHLRAYIFLVLR